MSDPVKIFTERLLLRQWYKADYELFARMNADPDVMRFYPNTLTTDQSNELASKFESLIKKNGWGFWAVELLDKQQFIGFVGLNKPSYILPVSPCVEIGWRLSKKYWGNGYASEAAKAALNFAFETLKLDKVYSFTSVTNSKSLAVMERLGMGDEKSNFHHPIIPEGHSLSEHKLYKIEK